MNVWYHDIFDWKRKRIFATNQNLCVLEIIVQIFCYFCMPSNLNIQIRNFNSLQIAKKTNYTKLGILISRHTK